MAYPQKGRPFLILIELEDHWTVKCIYRILAPDQRTFIVAIDHGANFNVLPAMKDAERVISEIASAGPDAFLTSVGLFDKFPGTFKGKGIILRVDGGVSFLGDHSTPLQTVISPEDALRLGADAIITMSFRGSKLGLWPVQSC